MLKAMLLALVFAPAFASPAPAQDTDKNVHPVRHDRTGIRWRTPFDAAQAQARKSGRLLAIKPVAFGTTPNGCW